MKTIGSSNLEIVVLITDEGSARSEHLLKEVWKERLSKVAPHYTVLSAKILVEIDDSFIEKWLGKSVSRKIIEKREGC